MSYFRKVPAGLVKEDITEFVGEVGNIFFNIDTGELRLSDGVTPGGLEIYLNGSQRGFTGSVGYSGSQGYRGILDLLDHKVIEVQLALVIQDQLALLLAIQVVKELAEELVTDTLGQEVISVLQDMQGQ